MDARAYLGRRIPLGVHSKKYGTSVPSLSTKISTAAVGRAVDKVCGTPSRVRFSQSQRFRPPPGPPALAPRRADRQNGLHPATPAGYPSPVCSNLGGAIDRIADAIDQVASDARGKIAEPELTARVAGIWLMMTALDPELARRQQRYTAPADGAPT